MPTPPNILLISADQMRADALGHTHPTHIPLTPTLDHLAATGASFSRAYCVSSVCTPSRAGIFTGRYPHVTGAWNIGVPLPDSEITLCDHLKPLGYTCLASGKLHFRPQCKPGLDWRNIHPESPAIRDRPRTTDHTYFGFDEYHIAEDNRVGEYRDWLAAAAPQLATNPNPNRSDEDIAEHGSDLPPELHPSHWITTRAIDMLQSRHNAPHPSPFFLWLSFVDPHHPWDAPRPCVDRYKKIPLAQIPLPIDRPGEHDLRPRHLRFQDDRYWPGGGQEHPHTPTQIQHIIRNYYAMISLIDDQIARLLSALDQLHLRDNTLILFTSDHGELLGDHHLLTKGPWHYEGLTRVPMIFHGPRIPPNLTTPALMENVDILPTLLDYLGSKIPYGIQGRSQLPVLQQKSPAVRQNAITAYDAHDRDIRLKTLITDRHKLNIFAGETYAELFDLQKDPHELHNVIDNPAYKEIRQDLYRQLTHRLIQDEDPLPLRQCFW